MTDLVKLGSETAKEGFQNERDVATKFNDWKNDNDAQKWLCTLGYDLKKIISVKSKRLKKGFKPDVYVKITTSKGINEHFISIKKANSSSDYNQVDKRKTEKYIPLWDIPEDIEKLLKQFSGEISPKTLLENNEITQEKYDSLKDERRMFINEFKTDDCDKILTFFKNKKEIVISDVLKGRPPYEADWILVKKVEKDPDKVSWKLTTMESAIEIVNKGEVYITKKGNIQIGEITLQRKGGDGGRDSANMLQFKMKPLILFRSD